MKHKKKILITGKDSYIGRAVKAWLMKGEQQVVIDEVCVKGDEWRKVDFSIYDVVFHVAGIAHSDTGKATNEKKALYYAVNTDLTIEVAKKAKFEGVGQFIFMSSMIVYGDAAPFGVMKRIGADTVLNPSNFYGDSKRQAEVGLTALKADDFRVAFIRPPMIYGKDSKGNYPRLAKLAKRLPLFPDVDNERSMLHIDNLCEFVRLVMQHGDDGVFHPQNAQYVKTSDMVATIAAVYGKKMYVTPFFNPMLKLLGRHVGIVNKVFGNLSYDLMLSEYKEDYRIRNFEESIALSKK